MVKYEKHLLPETTYTVFILSFYTIILELMLSRMSAFYLNYSNAFLAIPITLFGLAAGSLHVHTSKKKIDEYEITSQLKGLVLVSFLSFVLVFLLFSRFTSILPITHRNIIAWIDPIKTAIFSGLFIFPFYFIGKIFTILFTRNRHFIGRLYGVDLTGAAIGCFITPIFFHFLDLPHLISFSLLTISLFTLYVGQKYTIRLVVKFLVLNVAVLGIIIYLEGNYDLGKTINRLAQDAKVKEIAHKWNEFSRVSLLHIEDKGKSYYRIIHDNAESNVGIIPYRMSKKRSYEKRPDWMSIPFLFERKTNYILVMFAGCGKQMVQFNDYSAGKANITGVEINPLVKEFAIDATELKGFRMEKFHNLPNINLVIQEGRYFLDNKREKYNVIYVGSDAATSMSKTGHSRKYLDTYEAMKAYIDHLENDGLLLFQAQPAVHKIMALKKLFKEKGWQRFQDCVMVLSTEWDRADFLIVSSTPFTSSEREITTDKFKQDIYYMPGYEKNKDFASRLISGNSLREKKLVTDDRPYIRTLDFGNYNPFPSTKKLGNNRYYRSWIKITTLIFVLVVLFSIVCMFYVRKTEMPPLYITIYLLITGFCYMLIEITLIARLELFLGNPLLSMSLLLCVFLLSNGLGSRFFENLNKRINMEFLPLVATVAIFITLYAMESVITRFIGFPLAAKIPMTIILIAPTAFCLGLFYPYAVTWLNERNKVQTIPITYGLSTLSSVAGATYAMTMIINFGYTRIIYQAIVAYLMLFIITKGLSRFE